jgi:hypothetical protein
MTITYAHAAMIIAGPLINHSGRYNPAPDSHSQLSLSVPEQHQQHPQGLAAARHQQERAGNPERHVVLIAPEAEIEREDEQLEEREPDQPEVAVQREPAPSEQGRDQHGSEAVRGDRELELRLRKHPQRDAIRHQAPANRLRRAMHHRAGIFLPPEHRAQEVGERKGGTIRAEHSIGGDLVDLIGEQRPEPGPNRGGAAHQGSGRNRLRCRHRAYRSWGMPVPEAIPGPGWLSA